MRMVPEAGDVIQFGNESVYDEDQCQFCQTTNAISGESVEIDYPNARQDCTCDYCGAQFTDIYRLEARQYTEVPLS